MERHGDRSGSTGAGTGARSHFDTPGQASGSRQRHRRAAIDVLLPALKHLLPGERSEKANRIAEIAARVHCPA